MRHLRQDLSFAFRSFTRAPAFSALAVLVLALGIGANTATFSIANELLFRPISGRAGELVTVHIRPRTPGGTYQLFSYPDYAAIRGARDLFDDVAAHALTMVALTGDSDGRPRGMAAVVSANYFDTLGVALAAGRPFSMEEERPGARVPVAIASYARWARERFDPAFIGQRVTLNATDYTVIGIAPEGFSGAIAMLTPDVFLPLGVFEAVVSDRFKNDGRGLNDPGTEGLALIAHLSGGHDPGAAAPRLEALSRELEALAPDANRAQALSIHPLSRFSAGPTPQNNTALGAVSGLLLTLSGLVLVIACLNIANMLLARGEARRKELAVRLALGAGRGRVIRQLLTESMVLAVAGAIAGLAIGLWATATLAAALSSALPFTIGISATPDPRVVAVTIALAMMATIAFGLGPALKLSRRNLVGDLKERGPEGAAAPRWFATRNLLVVGQIALSLGLITAGGIFTRTAVDSAARTPGFSYDDLLVASLDTTLAGLDPARGQAAYLELVRRVRNTPGITSASLASTVPFGESIDSATFERVGTSDQLPVRARAYRIIGADYFRSLGLSMLRGREFTAAEEGAADTPAVAIVDAAFARLLFGGADPIGQVIRLARDPDAPAAGPAQALEIVGIAPPLLEELLDRAPVAHVYVPFGRQFRATMHVHARVAPGVDSRAMLDAIRREARATDPRLPLHALSTFADFHSRSLELLALRGSAVVFTGLGAMALLLSIVGVYGLRSYLVSQRTREIGIRMALGAAARDVVRQMMGDGLRLVAVGVAIGLPLAIAISLGFRSVFVDVGGFDPVVLSVATVTLTAAALAASAIPARRASRIEPLAALRAE
jgi:predicted permease